MPELAEVEFYRKQWDVGIGQKVLSVHLHATKRIFRGVDTEKLQKSLTGATLLKSESHGKQMMFRFSGNVWLGIHLGMTGKLRVEKCKQATTKENIQCFTPEKHEHLVLFQRNHVLIFRDPRQFGRVHFHSEKAAPAWWSKLPPALTSKQFTFSRMTTFLKRRTKAPIKAVLLQQQDFPGIGNWMADEILWRAGIFPGTQAGILSKEKYKTLYAEVRFVAREALRIIGKNFDDPPKSWLFKHRWRKGGNCPRCETKLKHAEIGGRTTCWCPHCQPKA